MTDQDIRFKAGAIRNTLDALESAALDPTTIVPTIAYSGILASRVGEFIDLCLLNVSGKLTEPDGTEEHK